MNVVMFVPSANGVLQKLLDVSYANAAISVINHMYLSHSNIKADLVRTIQIWDNKVTY